MKVTDLQVDAAPRELPPPTGRSATSICRPISPPRWRRTRRTSSGRPPSVSPDGQHVYAAGRIDDAVAVFDRDDLYGGLSFKAVYSDGVDGVEGLAGAADVEINPAGNRVLVAGRDGDGLCFDVDCNDADASDICEIFIDGFESGTTDAWSAVVG